jgi:ABC transport system ATP-binding/permease protein
VEDVLDGWPGTLVVVSHDRYLLERVTDHQMAMLGDGKLLGLTRGVDQYLELREAAMAAKSAPAAGSGTPSGPSEGQKREARKVLNRLERQLGKNSAADAKVHAQMAASVGDYDALADLNAKLAKLSKEREGLELEWLEASEVLE